jgi:hypothetical protein
MAGYLISLAWATETKIFMTAGEASLPATRNALKGVGGTTNCNNHAIDARVTTDVFVGFDTWDSERENSELAD